MQRLARRRRVAGARRRDSDKRVQPKKGHSFRPAPPLTLPALRLARYCQHRVTRTQKVRCVHRSHRGCGCGGMRMRDVRGVRPCQLHPQMIQESTSSGSVQTVRDADVGETYPQPSPPTPLPSTVGIDPPSSALEGGAGGGQVEARHWRGGRRKISSPLSRVVQVGWGRGCCCHSIVEYIRTVTVPPKPQRVFYASTAKGSVAGEGEPLQRLATLRDASKRELAINRSMDTTVRISGSRNCTRSQLSEIYI